MFALILSVAIEGLKFVNTKKAMEFSTKLYNLNIELMREEEKQYYSNDAKIEGLQKEIRITAEAARVEIMHAKKSS